MPVAGPGIISEKLVCAMNQKLVGDAFGLSPMQQGMLFHHLKEPYSGIDVEQLVVCLPEIVCVPRLEEAWRWLVRRHDILRTQFVWDAVERPQQVILPKVSVPFVFEDSQQLSESEQREYFKNFLEKDRLCGFELNCAPMLRIALFQWGESSFSLVWTFHHALLDGRCFPILLSEVF